MAPGPAIRALLLTALLLLLGSQAAFLLPPQEGRGWALEPVLYALVPALVLSIFAERLPLATRSRVVATLALLAAAFAALYGYLEATHAFGGCVGCASDILVVGLGPLLGFAGALALLLAGVLAFTVRPVAPQARTMTLARPGNATMARRPAASTNWPPGRSGGQLLAARPAQALGNDKGGAQRPAQATQAKPARMRPQP